MPLKPIARQMHWSAMMAATGPCPLFKDREEEAASASIGNAVEEALANSEFLIVVCSPNAAKSQWVNREIAWFKTHRDPANVFALIVGGELGAKKMPGREDEECFPKALTNLVNAEMEVTVYGKLSE